MEQQAKRPDRTTLMAFGGAVFLGGMNFVAIRFSNRELAPLFGAAIRFAAASALLFGFMGLKRIPLPRGAALFGTLVYGVLNFAVNYALMYWALTALPAGIGAVVFAAVPLLTLLLAPLHGVERFRARGLVGALMALVGFVIFTNAPSESALPVLPLLAMVGAAAAAAEAVVIVKKFPPTHPVATNAVAMGVSAPLLFIVSTGFGEPWRVPAEPATWISVAYLTLFGSVALFGLFLFTIKRWTVSAVSYAPVLMPIVAMIFGAALAGEAITPNGAIGSLIVLGGVYVGALSRGRSTKT